VAAANDPGDRFVENYAKVRHVSIFQNLLRLVFEFSHVQCKNPIDKFCITRHVESSLQGFAFRHPKTKYGTWTFGLWAFGPAISGHLPHRHMGTWHLSTKHPLLDF
jgi:hypothetical protein